MPTECNPTAMLFAPVERRQVAADFDGGAMTSDAGALLLGASDRAIGLVDRFASCFVDARRPDLVEHALKLRPLPVEAGDLLAEYLLASAFFKRLELKF